MLPLFSFFFPLFFDLDDEWDLFLSIWPETDSWSLSLVNKASDCTKLSVLWKIRRRNIKSPVGKMRLASLLTCSYITSSTTIDPVNVDVPYRKVSKNWGRGHLWYPISLGVRNIWDLKNTITFLDPITCRHKSATITINILCKEITICPGHSQSIN